MVSYFKHSVCLCSKTFSHLIHMICICFASVKKWSSSLKLVVFKINKINRIRNSNRDRQYPWHHNDIFNCFDMRRSCTMQKVLNTLRILYKKNLYIRNSTRAVSGTPSLHFYEWWGVNKIFNWQDTENYHDNIYSI